MKLRNVLQNQHRPKRYQFDLHLKIIKKFCIFANNKTKITFFSEQTATPRGAATPKQPSPPTESVPAAKPVPIEAPHSSTVNTVQTVENTSELNAVQTPEATSNPIETVAAAEIVTITETTVTSTNETHDNKTDSITISESETVSSVDNDTTKLSEPENSEMTGKHQPYFGLNFSFLKLTFY